MAIKKIFKAGVIVILIIVGSFGSSNAQKNLNGNSQDGKPNIIVLMTDDWGWGDLGVHGNERIQTPNIDQLAAEGIRFTQFYQGDSVCSPSRGSMMTGLFPLRHGIHGAVNTVNSFERAGIWPPYLNPELPMLPRLLKEAGYATALYGKWHLTAVDALNAPLPEAYGLDDHRVTVGYGAGIHFLLKEIKGWNTWEDARLGDDLQRPPWQVRIGNPDWRKWRAESSSRIVDESIKFIENHRNEPFYIQAWFYDTHATLTPTFSQMAPFEDLPEPYRIYYAAVLDTDRQIGRLMKRLKELGLSENTIVIFTSDNGPENLEIFTISRHGVGDPGPFRGRKRSGYEGGVRLPFIVHWPNGTPAGKVDSQTVISAVDMLPTLASLAGAEVLQWPEVDGQDMSQAFRGKPVKERKRPLYWRLQSDTYVHGPKIDRSPKLIIRDGRWKLLMHPDGTGIELYDIEANSLEVDNLADTNPEVAKRLSEQLRQWYDKPANTY